MSRKSISLTTKLASALLALGDIPYRDAKQMTAAQVMSLYQFDHGILHETGDQDVDKFWNLTPRLIREHRTKTKADAKIIAKGRRIRRKYAAADAPAPRTGPGGSGDAVHGAHDTAAHRPARSHTDSAAALTSATADRAGRTVPSHGAQAAVIRPARTLRSRGFDKRFRRKMSGKVVPR